MAYSFHSKVSYRTLFLPNPCALAFAAVSSRATVSTTLRFIAPSRKGGPDDPGQGSKG